MALAMSIQIDDGEFTRLHNTILEKLALARFIASEYRCLMFLFRMTYGWQKKEDEISLSQWAKGTGIDVKKRHNVLRTLQGLIDKGVITAKSNGNNRPMTWGFNKNFAQWNPSLFDETVISPDNSLGPTVISGDSRPVISAENSTVISPDNKTVISPDNHKRKKEILKKEERERETHPPDPPPVIASGLNGVKQIRISSPHLEPRRFVNGFVPPGKGTSAVEVYYERFSINLDEERLSKPSEDDLVLNCPDLELLREVIAAYHRSPHRRRNIRLILDWYREPSRFRKDHHGTNNGRNGSHYERPPDAAFTQQEWDSWRESQSGEEIPF